MVTIMLQNDSPCLSDFWNLETIGNCDPIHVKDDNRALEKFNNTIYYQEGRYFITWPGSLMMWSYHKILMLPLEE